MPVLLWLARLVGAAIVYLFNLILVSGLVLLSAHVFAQVDEDAAIPGYVLRVIAAVWLWAATWRLVRHSILLRPRQATSRDATKPSAREVVVSSAGCLASLAVVAGLVFIVGPLADWVYDGLVHGPPSHPVQVTLHRVVDGTIAVAENPERAFAYFVGVSLFLLVLRAVTRTSEGERTPVRPSPRKKRAQRDETSRPVPSVPAAMQQMDTVHARHQTDAAHKQAPHRAGPSSAPRTSRSGRTIDDPMLGVLQRDDAAEGWRLVNPRPQVGTLLIKADGEPTHEQMEFARTLVQRSFEVLLRASEGARPTAQANGVGLPRFTLVDSTIHAPKNRRSAVSVRLQCEGDPKRTYEVTSTDGMHTFGT